MGRSSGPVTADELMDKLEADPEWTKKAQEQDRQWLAGVRQNAKDWEPIIAELEAQGFQMPSKAVRARYHDEVVYLKDPRDIKNLEDALPILIKWLPKIKNRSIKKALIQTIAVKGSKVDVLTPLVSAFLTEKDEDIKWTIGERLAYIANDETFDKVFALATDKRHGKARAMLVWGLGKMKKHREQAVKYLLEAINDKDVAVNAMIALGNLKVKEAREVVERFLDDKDSWVRSEAKKALAKIDKS